MSRHPYHSARIVMLILLRAARRHETLHANMLLARLKAETVESHARLEALIPLAHSTRDHVTQLKVFFGFVEPWERELAAALPDTDVVRAGRQKTPWLVEDLDFFGIGADARPGLPRTTELPSLASRSEILGAAYVLEGSTLGGQFIARHLETQLGLRDGCGYRYFRSYGADVGARWQAFRAELSRVSSPVTDAAIIGAAGRTFDLLHRWFSIQLHYGRLPSEAIRPAGPQHV